jgi:hypothetical protein
MKNDYKYDEFGQLDTDYYVAQAKTLRNAYFAELAKSLIKNAKAMFKKDRSTADVFHSRTAH